ncbi:MAG: hypothetical protein ACPG4T_24495, partial [Nannocystaceae bacterium]
MTATTSIQTQLNNLENLRLPELQACFKQVVGKATRAPNRKFLIRKIREAAAQQEDDEELTDPPKPSPDTSPKPAPAKKTRRTKEASAPVAPPPKPEPTILTSPLGPIEVGTHA